MKMNTVEWVAFILVVVGALNWGLVGAFNYNLVETMLGHSLANVVYIVVGLGALYTVYMASTKKAR